MKNFREVQSDRAEPFINCVLQAGEAMDRLRESEPPPPPQAPPISTPEPPLPKPLDTLTADERFALTVLRRRGVGAKEALRIIMEQRT